MSLLGWLDLTDGNGHPCHQKIMPTILFFVALAYHPFKPIDPLTLTVLGSIAFGPRMYGLYLRARARADFEDLSGAGAEAEQGAAVMVPATRPEITREALLERVRAAHPALTLPEVFLVGCRGFSGPNQRGVYDDAIVLVTPEGITAFNANCDPSRFRKGIASLVPGAWRYRVGTHNLSKPAALRYEALVQAAPVTVARDEQGEETGWFGINIHRGGTSTTGSLGCQTIVPAQWPGFLRETKAAMKAAKQTEIPYLLLAWEDVA